MTGFDGMGKILIGVGIFLVVVGLLFVFWPKIPVLAKTVAEISRLGTKLREELAVIRLRRIVPGRCRYCPL